MPDVEVYDFVKLVNPRSMAPVAKQLPIKQLLKVIGGMLPIKVHIDNRRVLSSFDHLH